MVIDDLLNPHDELLRQRVEADEPDYNLLDALVASGDCFVTLATQLDSTSKHLLADSPGHESLESVIRSLLDLQRRFRIIKKPADYRQ